MLRVSRLVDPRHGTRVAWRARYSLVGKFGGYLAGSPVPVVCQVDLDDFLFIV